MGNSCNSTDNDETIVDIQRPYQIQEQFDDPSQPFVNQNYLQFNDDDPIYIPRSNSRYGANNIDQISTSAYVLQNNLQLSIKTLGLNQNEGQNNILLMASVTTQPLKLDNNGKISQRPGIDLICVIDHSGSMEGDKMHMVRKSLRHMLEFLGPQDRVCLIKFDDVGERLTRLMRVTHDNKKKFVKAINKIHARDGTLISTGMQLALQVIGLRTFKNPICGIFLLSDGEDFGASQAVAQLLQQCYISDPFTIMSFGFGEDVCPKMMSEIAHMKEGQFYFVKDTNVINECFIEAIGGLVSVVGTNFRMTIKTNENTVTKITKIYGDKWQSDQGTQQLYQPHLLAGLTKSYMLEVAIPNLNSDSGIITVSIESDPREFGNRYVTSQSIQISQQYEDQDSVIANWLRVRSAESFRLALYEAEAGNFFACQQILGGLAQEIRQTNYQDPQTLMVLNDILLAQYHCTQYEYARGGRHYLMKLYIVHMYQRSRGIRIVSHIGQPVQCVYSNNVQNAYRTQAVSPFD